MFSLLNILQHAIAHVYSDVNVFLQKQGIRKWNLSENKVSEE